MAKIRIFKSDDFMRPADDEPIRTVITESEHATVVAWYVKPGQRIAAHVHPDGQDTWTVLSGQGEYQLEAGGKSQTIGAGDVVLAHAGCVHGVYNAGTEPLRFISVVCPLEAGYRLVPTP
jgi:quercetin dioxygenase-like cupin family protein